MTVTTRENLTNFFWFLQTVVLARDERFIYRLLIDRVTPASDLFFSIPDVDGHRPVSLLQWSDPPAASETSNNAAPAFVQLGLVGADVAPYIPQSEERLTAERTRPVLSLHVPEAVHDESITVLVGGLTLQTGVGRLGDLGGLTPRPPELLQPGPARSVQHDAAQVARGGFGLLWLGHCSFWPGGFGQAAAAPLGPWPGSPLQTLADAPLLSLPLHHRHGGGPSGPQCPVGALEGGERLPGL